MPQMLLFVCDKKKILPRILSHDKQIIYSANYDKATFGLY